MIVNEIKKIEIEFTEEEEKILSEAKDILYSLYFIMGKSKCSCIKTGSNYSYSSYYDIKDLDTVIEFLEDSCGFREIE